MNDIESPLIDNIIINIESNEPIIKKEINYITDLNIIRTEYERKRIERMNKNQNIIINRKIENVCLTTRVEEIIEEFKEGEKKRLSRLYDFI